MSECVGRFTRSPNATSGVLTYTLIYSYTPIYSRIHYSHYPQNPAAHCQLNEVFFSECGEAINTNFQLKFVIYLLVI